MVERKKKLRLEMHGEAASGFKRTEVNSSRGLLAESWEKKHAKVLYQMKAWCD